MAKNTTEKQVLSLRVNRSDISRIKSLAQDDEIPYQTLMQSILHRYAHGTLKRAD
jgi:predicted DNA binding CopG/RHH family protein